MHGFGTDHEFLYVVLNVFKQICGFKRFSLFEPSLGDMAPHPTPVICVRGLPYLRGAIWVLNVFPRLSQVWGDMAPHPTPMICVRGLPYLRGAIWGDTLGKLEQCQRYY